MFRRRFTFTSRDVRDTFVIAAAMAVTAIALFVWGA